MSLRLGTTLLAGVATNTIANAHDLFDFIWSDHIKNEVSWLRADTFSWQDGTVYTNAYTHLYNDIQDITSSTETIGSYTITYYLAEDGHKIVMPDQETILQNIYTESGVAWYYVLDTTNTRFKLPRTKYGFTGYRDGVGKYVEAGLPNITGSVGYTIGTNSSATGSITKDNDSNSAWWSGATNVARASTFYLDASRSSSIYGNSTTVQPPATQMYLYFYVGQFSQSATEQTAGLNTELFNGKADIDLENVPSNIGNTAKSFFGGLGMPSHTYDNLTLLASGNTYTAPANGYFYVKKFAGGTGKYISIMNTSTGLAIEAQPTASGNAGNIYLPVKKDDVVQISYNVTGNTDHFMFIYAVGSESEAS